MNPTGYIPCISSISAHGRTSVKRNVRLLFTLTSKEISYSEFGPEYANGAFQARLHFNVPGRLFISTHQQSDFEEFSKTQVASEARMYLKTEPILLDNFISELKALNSGASNEATLVSA